MNVRTLYVGGVLLVAAVAAGCSSSPDAREEPRRDDCRRAASCIYEGKYEPGEREYAEREAERLNQEATRKLRRWR